MTSFIMTNAAGHSVGRIYCEPDTAGLVQSLVATGTEQIRQWMRDLLDTEIRNDTRRPAVFFSIDVRDYRATGVARLDVRLPAVADAARRHFRLPDTDRVMEYLTQAAQDVAEPWAKARRRQR